MSDPVHPHSADAQDRPVGFPSNPEISLDPFRAFDRAVADFEESTSRELTAQNRLHRLAWATFLSVPIGFLGVNVLLLGIASRAASANGTPFGALVAAGVALLGAVALILFFTFAPWRWKRFGPSRPHRDEAETTGLSRGLQKTTEELVRIQVEVDRMRRRASDTVLLIAIVLILLGGLASNLVAVAFPELSWITSLIISDTIFGASAIAWATFYWRATLRRTRRMESRARALTEGLGQLEAALWSRF